MIIRAMGLGFLLWLALAAVFRFFGQVFFIPDETARMLTFFSAPVVGIAAAWILLKLLKEARGDEGEAAIGLALPVLLMPERLTRQLHERAMTNSCVSALLDCRNPLRPTRWIVTSGREQASAPPRSWPAPAS